MTAVRPVFIADYIRTPIGRYGGILAQVRPDDLAACVLRALCDRQPGLAATVDEVVLGCANQAGEDNRNVARMSALLAGLPETVPGLTVNRLCASGMDAVILGYRAIAVGEADVVISGGVESMSRAPFVLPKAARAFERAPEIHDTTIGWRFVNDAIEQQYGIESMPETAENVAEEFDVSRAEQDTLALSSQTRALAAWERERLAEEVIPVHTPRRSDPEAMARRDEHPRQTSLEKLAALPTPFREGGTVTAGNASGVNDAAAALVLASERGLEAFGTDAWARIAGAASAGVAPRVMGLGPVPAVQALASRTGRAATDYDLVELNEAFAAQAIAVCRALGLDPLSERVNPNGGAIALGHPLGMTGARLVGTAALDLRQGRAASALCTLCVGVGQGVALALERPEH